MLEQRGYGRSPVCVGHLSIYLKEALLFKRMAPGKVLRVASKVIFD